MKSAGTYDKILAKAREAVAIPSKYGHSDIGDVLVRWLRSELSDEEAIGRMDDLMSDYRTMK